MSVDVQVVQTVRELASLKSDWDALSARFGSPLFDHDWYATAAETLHDEQDLRVVTVREAGQLIAAAPMAIRRADRHLIVLGTSALFEPSGWLFSSARALQHLANAALDMGEVVVLDRVPAELELCRLLPRTVRGHAVTITRETAPSFAVRTDRPWAAVCSTLSSRTRRRLDAARRRAEQICADVRVDVLWPEPGNVDEAFTLLTGVEAAGWKRRNGSALALRPDLSRFFQLYARRAAGDRRLHVCVIWIGDVPAAIEFAVVAHNRLWSLKIGYDEQFASCSPGRQVVHASIKSATEQGLAAYEFLGSAEPWQERWKPERRQYRVMAVYPLNSSAILGAVSDLIRSLSRRLRTQSGAHGGIG